VKISPVTLEVGSCVPLKAEFSLLVRATDDRYATVPFRLDTGAELSTIPISIANDLGIAFKRHNEVKSGGVGEASSFINCATFRFPEKTETLESEWAFTEAKLSYGLFGLTDIRKFFHFRQTDGDATYEPAYGYFDLFLRAEFRAKH